MARKTAGVELLVCDVLATMPEPYSEDIIDEVCHAIETNPEWKRRYDELGDVLRPWVVNNWIGQYVKAQTGRNSGREVKARKSQIIKDYTILIR